MVLVAGLAGSVFVQGVMVPLLAIDLEDVDVRVPVLVIVVLGIVTIQVTMVCVWRLLTMVRRGTVFSTPPSGTSSGLRRHGGASVLAFALGVTLAPGEGVAPGMVLLIGGAGVLVAGVALVVLVLRMLLAQAVALDVEAKHLQAELSEVI